MGQQTSQRLQPVIGRNKGVVVDLAELAEVAGAEIFGRTAAAARAFGLVVGLQEQIVEAREEALLARAEAASAAKTKLGTARTVKKKCCTTVYLVYPTNTLDEK